MNDIELNEESAQAPATTRHLADCATLLLSKDEVLARRSYKWRQYPAGVMAACVADMDLRVAPEVQAAIERSVNALDYGYPLRDGKRADRLVAQAFAQRMADRFAWHVDPAQVLVLADLVQATYAAILAFSEPGDGVILQVPNYPPFREAIEGTGRRLIPLEMEHTAQGYVFDLAKLEASVDDRTRLLLLCNPHNPTGRVLTRAELTQVAAFAERHNLIVISDEIHCDLLYPGVRHVPIASISPEAAARTITLNSATKSFNIAGLRCAAVCFGTEALMERFHRRVPWRLTGSVNSLGIDATVVAWTQGQRWLDAVLAHLLAMRNHAMARLRSELPAVGFHAPEATYLLWLDCTGLGIEGPAFDFFLEHAQVGLGAGVAFHPGADKFVRLNFATSPSILDEILDRMVGAIRRYGGHRNF